MSETAKKFDSFFDELFPICRSITGPGYKRSLEILSGWVPFEKLEFASGTQVFDWEVPPEWHIRSAKLMGPQGETIADFKESNLSVMNFSEAVDQRLSLDELQKHLVSMPELPEARPYATSYYKRNWAFCIPHKQREALKSGEYHAVIDSSFEKGHLEVGEIVLKGDTDQEVLLSSYLCHPSLANNELSGPLVLCELYDRLSKKKSRHFTYRFVINPETIGSICYLTRRGDHLKEKMAAGFVLTCLGGNQNKLSYKLSRSENSFPDQLMLHLAKSEKLRIRNFDASTGSDERQYCSPGFNLPVGQIARTHYLEYEGYHNSFDSKEFMNTETLVDSVDQIEKILEQLEWSMPFKNTVAKGEVMLGKRGLYPSVNSPSWRKASTDGVFDGRKILGFMMNTLSFSDGDHSLIQIADRLNINIDELIPVAKKLYDEGLLVRSDFRS